MSRSARLAVAVLILLCAGCKVSVDLDLERDGSGSGTIRASGSDLPDDAPGFAKSLRKAGFIVERDPSSVRVDGERVITADVRVPAFTEGTKHPVLMAVAQPDGGDDRIRWTWNRAALGADAPSYEIVLSVPGTIVETTGERRGSDTVRFVTGDGGTWRTTFTPGIGGEAIAAVVVMGTMAALIAGTVVLLLGRRRRAARPPAA